LLGLLFFPVLCHAAPLDWREVETKVNYDPAQVFDEAEKTLREARLNHHKAEELKAFRIYLRASAYLDREIEQNEVETGMPLARELSDDDALCEILMVFHKGLSDSTWSRQVQQALAFAE